jgi:hypothetical protein
MSDTKEAELRAYISDIVQHESQKLRWQIVAAYLIFTCVLIFFILSFTSLISWQASLMVISLCVYGVASYNTRKQALADREQQRLEAEAEKRKNDDLYDDDYDIPVHQTHALVRLLLIKRFQKHYLNF